MFEVARQAVASLDKIESAQGHALRYLDLGMRPNRVQLGRPTMLEVRVYLAGGIHEDPLCRPRLVGWLKQLLGKEGQPPRLIAVENDPNVKATLTMERGRFTGLAGGLWGDALDPAVGDLLSRTLGWEFDGHREVIDQEPLFLDDQGTRAHAVEAGIHLAVTKMRLGGYAGDRTNLAAIADYSSLVSAKGPSMTVRWAPENLTRAPFELA